MNKTRMFVAGFTLTLAGSLLLSNTPPQKADRKFETGRVQWHKDHTAAIAAARKSGKPVLHFQLLGKLDEEFC